MITAISPLTLKVNDSIMEHDGRKWVHLTTVQKVEKFKCGIHVNGRMCYNDLGVGSVHIDEKAR